MTRRYTEETAPAPPHVTGFDPWVRDGILYLADSKDGAVRLHASYYSDRPQPFWVGLIEHGSMQAGEAGDTYAQCLEGLGLATTPTIEELLRDCTVWVDDALADPTFPETLRRVMAEPRVALCNLGKHPMLGWFLISDEGDGKGPQLEWAQSRDNQN